MHHKLLGKDSALVVAGQIVSLFGNAILRFSLPLFLLRETGSSALFGMVTAALGKWLWLGKTHTYISNSLCGSHIAVGNGIFLEQISAVPITTGAGAISMCIALYAKKVLSELGGVTSNS